MSKSNSSDTGLNQIGQISIPVTDIERSVTFYRDILKMQFLFQVPPGLAFFNCGGIRLMLDSSIKENAGKCSIIYYKVDNLHTTFDFFSANGITFETKPHLVAKMPDHELWMAFFRDPDENILALMSEL